MAATLDPVLWSERQRDCRYLCEPFRRTFTVKQRSSSKSFSLGLLPAILQRKFKCIRQWFYGQFLLILLILKLTGWASFLSGRLPSVQSKLPSHLQPKWLPIKHFKYFWTNEHFPLGCSGTCEEIQSSSHYYMVLNSSRWFKRHFPLRHLCVFEWIPGCVYMYWQKLYDRFPNCNRDEKAILWTQLFI